MLFAKLELPLDEMSRCRASAPCQECFRSDLPFRFALSDCRNVELPRVLDNSQPERIGVAAVMMAMAKGGQIWRETPHSDIGIDGQIEHVGAEGKVTGRILAVQVKSGESFFKHEHDQAWHFYPEEKHRMYWERFPVPVLLCLHNPTTLRTYWVDARHWLRSPSTSTLRYIAVPKNQVLENTSVEQLFIATGAESGSFLSVEDVLHRLLASRSPNASCPVSYFELFVFGLTNICRTLYFHMDVVMNVAEHNLIEEGWGMGSSDYEFIFDYVRFITAQHIADVDFSDCMIDWVDREMTPRFFAPLTSRGRELVKLIGLREDQLKKDGKLSNFHPGIRVAQETLVAATLTPGTIARFPLVSAFMENHPAMALSIAPKSLDKADDGTL